MMTLPVCLFTTLLLSQLLIMNPSREMLSASPRLLSHLRVGRFKSEKQQHTKVCLSDFNKRRALLHTLTHSSLCILKLSQHTLETCSCGNSRCQREVCVHLRHTFFHAIMSFMCLKVCAANEVLTKTKRGGLHVLWWSAQLEQVSRMCSDFHINQKWMEPTGNQKHAEFWENGLNSTQFLLLKKQRFMHCWYTGIWDEWWTEGMPCSCSLCPKSNIKREEAANHKTQTKNKQPNLTRSVPERWENCSKSWKKTRKHHHTHNLLSSLQVRVLFSWQSLTLHFWWSLCFSFVGWGHFLWQPGCDDHAAIISAFLGLRQAGLGHTHTHRMCVQTFVFPWLQWTSFAFHWVHVALP